MSQFICNILETIHVIIFDISLTLPRKCLDKSPFDTWLILMLTSTRRRNPRADSQHADFQKCPTGWVWWILGSARARSGSVPVVRDWDRMQEALGRLRTPDRGVGASVGRPERAHFYTSLMIRPNLYVSVWISRNPESRVTTIFGNFNQSAISGLDVNQF